MAATPGGTYAKIAGAGLSTANRATTEGYDAGLRGEQLALHVGTQGGLEAGIAAIFQAKGFGGTESLLAGKTLAVWGLAFKPRTDDIRESPALALIDSLLAAGVSVRVHDPEAMANVRAAYGDRLVYADRPYGALEGADGLAVVTEWPEFRNPDFEVMRRLLQGRVIFDGRNLYDPKAMAGYGFTYYGIGRGGDKPARGT